MINEGIVLEFDDKEMAVIEAFAKEHGLSIEDAVRKILFDHINEHMAYFFRLGCLNTAHSEGGS